MTQRPFDVGPHDPMTDVDFHLHSCTSFPYTCPHAFELVIPGDGRSAFARVCPPFPELKPFWNLDARVRVLTGPRQTPFQAGELTLDEARQLVARFQHTRDTIVIDALIGAVWHDSCVTQP